MKGYECWAAKPNEYVTYTFIGVVTGYYKGFTTTVTMRMKFGSMDDAFHHFRTAIGLMGITNANDIHVCRED